MVRLFNPVNSKARDAIKLIIVFTLVKVVVAFFFPATIDEAYAIVVSRQWSLSYFDHPPLSFTIARLMAWLTGTEAIFFARLPFILMGAASAWLIYLITKKIYDDTSAIWALIWFLIAPFFFISAGHFVVPDGPLNLALLLSFYCLLPLLLKQQPGSNWRPWLGFGLFLAIALLAKYQAVLFGLSILIFLTTTPFGRSQLATIPPWIAAGICILGLLPVLVWNMQNDFISFSFQSARAGNETGLQPLNFLITMLGQAVYLLPITFILALGLSAKRLRPTKSPAEAALSWLVLLPFTIFAIIALVSSKSLPHWPMSGFLSRVSIGWKLVRKK
ncbi:MAG: glycosyltransferase family 39 protein [Ahrensia sp.]|nr:glycosyltransferase family 39 protein [Ahrensia sp.]